MQINCILIAYARFAAQFLRPLPAPAPARPAPACCQATGHANFVLWYPHSTLHPCQLLTTHPISRPAHKICTGK